MMRHRHALLFLLFCGLFFGLYPSTLPAQAFDKDFYLVDSLDVDALLPTDKAVIDSCLRLYHASDDDSIRLQLLIALVDGCVDETAWRPYNSIVLETVPDKLDEIDGMSAETVVFYMEMLAHACNNEGYVADLGGKWNDAIELYRMALELFEEIGNESGKANALTNLGTMYSNMGELGVAQKYYDQSIEIYKENGDTAELILVYNNLSAIYEEAGDLDAAMKATRQAQALLGPTGNDEMRPMVLSQAAGLIARNGDEKTALQYFKNALKANEPYGQNESWAHIMTNIAEIQMHLGKLDSAQHYAEQAYAVTLEKSYASIFSNITMILSRIFREKGDFEQSLNYYEAHNEIEDSLRGIEVQKKAIKQEVHSKYREKQIADSLMHATAQEIKDAHIHEQQAELAQARTEKYALLGGLLFFLLFAVFVILSNRKLRIARNKIDVQKHLIEFEKRKSDDLLLNILPASTAEELKQKGHAEPQLYDQVTVMFVDIVGFTRFAEQLGPAELVQEIDHCFRAFDEIISRYPIEKIKTIGDAYMCAAGLPLTNETHSVDMVAAALEIRDFVMAHHAKREAEGKPSFAIRLGIHTGPVVAGVVGTKKFAYDLWGDTVNLAARMESSGEVGRVNISQSTYEAVKTNFKCSHRGKVEAKNKGKVDMYFAEP